MQNDVKQVDRDAAIAYWGNDNPPLELQRTMAAHRIAAEAAKDAEIAALQARVAELEGAAINIIDHTERYEGQDRFTIAKWQMDALEGAVCERSNGRNDG